MLLAGETTWEKQQGGRLSPRTGAACCAGLEQGKQAAVAVTSVLLSGKHFEFHCFHLKYWPASCPDQHYPTCIFSKGEIVSK